ncbi:MAG: hypothetical protein Q9207_005057 [Kuettlingeria erythrocarpa]
MAPEILQGGPQTLKVDIWSLFVTVAYTLNANGYRDRQIDTRGGLITAALAAADDPQMARIKEMATVDPEKRASAAQMLVKNYDGAGLSTPRGEVPDLHDSSRGQEPRRVKKARGVPKLIGLLNAQNRVQKRHHFVQTTIKPHRLR